MKTGKNLFLVLVPHRDIRFALRKYGADLLKTVIKDAFLFPQVVPLAALCAPLTKDELKQIARAIKETVMANGKIITKETAAVPFPVNESKTVLFGPRFEPVIPKDLLFKTKSIEKKITDFFLTQVIGCLLADDAADINTAISAQLSFRAAAVANMRWKKAEGGWEWETGELIWLPKSLTKYKLM